MEEEPKTADLRKQLKEDKKKFEKAMECILTLEKSVSGCGENDGHGLDDHDDFSFDREPSQGPDSELGEPYHEISHQSGEVVF